MLGRLAKLLISSPGGASPWLPAGGNPFLYTLHLRGVADPLDPNPLWEHEYAGGATIQDVASGRNDRRLRTALDAHRHMGSRRDAESRRLVADPRVYTDVLLRIPQSAWRAARYDDRLLIMADELARMHGEDFQNHLLDGRRARYLVVPEDRLPADEVICQFGMGVFLPDAEDRQVGEARFLLGESEEELPPWQSYEMGGDSKHLVSRPAGVYRDQHYLLLGHDLFQGTILFPRSLGGYQGYVAIDLASGRPALEFSDGAALETRVEGDRQMGEFICTLRPRDCEETQGFGILIRRKAAATPPSPAPSAAAGHTIVLGRSTGGPCLRLTALALPTLDGIASSGVTGWRLALNPDGTPSEMASGGAVLTGKAGDKGIYLRRPGEAEYRPMPLPAQGIDCGKGCAPLELMPSTVSGYLALLLLPAPVPYLLPKAVQETGVVLGGQPNGDEAGIALNLLNQLGSLLGCEGMLNNLVSRRFVKVIQTGEGLRIELLSSSYPAYLLDREYHLRGTLGFGAGSGLLHPGEHLQIGLYVLRYEP
ncbi:MAG: hypothetical protein A2286_06370 [Gammaproteobacteria bacterium RIFOXYA12_FULL_61_12]|nr:MAG: hypothetical protein A2514_00670 [Gammaproteobacteria bacterium RIFOXYD12_FULL_61_37]OGT93721.1 MAG: hypothetical protein A2286_06370 [Gammaproteobacteria bacterium RIFOXYA12_FULL_61_12]